MKNDLGQALAAFAKKGKADLRLVVRKTMIQMVDQVVKMSPVGDPSHWKGKPPAGYVGGRFRNNWQVGLGSINSTTLDNPDKSGNAAIARAQKALDGFEPGKIIYVSNNLPYAHRLEFEGHSKQAPNGMVRLTIQNFTQALRKAAQEVNK